MKQELVCSSCPRCKSNRTSLIRGKDYMIMGWIVIVVGFLLALVPPLCLICILAGIGLLVISPFIKDSYFCQDCKLSWKLNEVPFLNR
jgi:membrane glycosyltransferase